MGARLNPDERSMFIIEKPELRSGAVAIGAPNFAANVVFDPPPDIAGRYPKKYTWLVCPHLSRPDLVYKYYMASGLITIVLGKCFCESCFDMILSRSDLSELIGSSVPMTDQQFQENFIRPLIGSNYHFTNMVGHIADHDELPKTWVSCSHLAAKDCLKKTYGTGGQIFIFESYFTCQDCFERIPTNSLVDLLYEGEPMTDAHFQERIIDSLYAINHESMQTFGHYDVLPA